MSASYLRALRHLWIILILPSVFAAERANVVLLVADDLRPDAVHALGDREVETPNLDRLARQGTVLTHATCAYPLCVPSRAEILTGCSAFQNGVGIRANALDKQFALWPAVMQRAGYRTYHVGKWHVAGRPSQRGYESSMGLFAGGKKPAQPQYDHRGRLVTGYVGWQFQTDDGQLFPERGIGLTPNISETFADAAIQVIRQPDEHPFFLHVNFTAPHDPRLIPTGYDKRYDPARLSLPKNFLAQHPFDHGNRNGRDEILLPIPRTEEEVRAELAAYYAVVSHLDAQIGRILEALEQTGQAQNTFVIFTSDHGLAIGSHGLIGKQNMYDHTVRVPMIMRGPGIRSDARLSALCYLRDLFPTVCDLCAIDIPPTLEGQSMRRVLRGETQSVYPFVIGYFQNVQRMIRTDRWKLIWYRKIEKEQLFDLSSDPNELQDLAGMAQHDQVQSELRTRLREWLAAHHDPVLDQP